MLTRKSFLPAALLMAMLALSACAGATPAVATPAPAIAAVVPATATVVPATSTALPPTATRVPPTAAATATAVPPTKAPTAAATATTPIKALGGMPDAKADPLAALLYAGSSGAFKSARFTYEMNVKMAPADDATAKAMGEEASTMLQALSMQGTGTGVMQIVDAAAGKVNTQMTFEMTVMGQKMKIETVVIGQDSWARLGGGAWQKAEGASTASTGADPTTMLDAFRSASKVKWLDDKPLNGEAVHHLGFALDPSQIDLSGLALGAAGETVKPEDLKALTEQMTIEAEAWLAAKDLTMRQQHMLITIVMPMPEELGSAGGKLRMDMDMLMRFSDLNKAVVIEPPK